MSNGVFLYFLFGTVLFFFWIYGIISFIVDLRRKIIPWFRARWKKKASEPSGPDSDLELDPETEQLRELYGDSEDER